LPGAGDATDVRQRNMLAIFDNDGTICDTQEVEGRCFALVIERVTGQSLASVDWTKYVEPTSTAIIRDILAEDPAAKETEDRIEVEFCRLLEENKPRLPGDFVLIPGAVQFLRRLVSERASPMAIATGCFETSAGFKLKCCGIILEHYPYATSMDAPNRRDIYKEVTI
jgi:phosphoglycolate phosphatase-like HAD superfamily hydrolase